MDVGRLTAFCALAILAARAFAAPAELKVVGERVNLRTRPIADAEVAGQVSTGETLVAPDGLPDGAEWVKVRPPQSVDLWIFSALVNDGVVTADDTYVRCGPGQHYRHVGKVGKGFKVEPRGPANGDWLRIAPVPTAELYINAAYVLAVPPPPAPEPARPESPEKPAVAAAPKNLEPPELPAAAKTPEEPVKLGKPETPAAAKSPNKPAPVQRPAPDLTAPPPPPLPASLAGYRLATGPRQGEQVRIGGRLERLSLARAPGFSRYQLVDKAGYSKSSAICRIVGLSGQWFELAGSEVEIEGRLWTLEGDPVPVIDATRAIRVASWEK